MSGDDWRTRDLAHVWHPYTRFSTLRDEPLPVIARGEGIYLYDTEGRRWTDAISSWWACALGHGRPEIVAAIQAQAERLPHSILGNLTHPGAIELAERLARRMPDARRHVHFASDGAGAVEAALKIALQYAAQRGEPQRNRLAALRGAYHGDTLGAVSVGFLDAFHAPLRDALRPALTLPVPARPEDEPAARAAAETVFAAQGREIAALIVEPLCQGASGMRFYSSDYLRFLHGLARAHGALFIVDEIAVGFGRLGTWFAFEQAGIDPDIVCLGKALTAGYLPLSAAVARDEIYETFADGAPDRTFYHGHTFAGNPLGAAAALAALDIYEKENIPARAAELAPRLSAALAPLRGGGGVREVRTRGLVGAIELDSAARARAARRRLQQRHILCRPLGPVVYLMPPLTITAGELDALAADYVGAVTAVGAATY